MADSGSKGDTVAIKIGIIGGSGLDNPDLLEQRRDVIVETPFGPTSDAIVEGKIAGVPCALLSRHGRKHNINPSNVNYRANIWALRHVGCTHVIVTNACGSLREEIRPGDLVIPNDFIDRTNKRENTFFDGTSMSDCQGVCHLPMYPAYSERVRQVFLHAAKELQYDVRDGATLVCVEGPRFSSRAESNMFRIWGGDLVGMTTCPEIMLAKEAGLLYGGVAIATDYDCWREGCESVNVRDVLDTFQKNVQRVKQLLIKVVSEISQQEWQTDILKAKSNVSENMMG